MVRRRYLLLSLSLLFLMLIFPVSAFAAEKAPAIDTGDTTWMLISTAIVLFMHVPGLALFYGGLVSEKNVISTMMHSFVSLLIITVVWVLSYPPFNEQPAKSAGCCSNCCRGKGKCC